MMGDFVQKDMTGVLFKNERKVEDSHPDHTGTATVGGVKWELSAWVKEIKTGPNAGKKYFAINFRPPKER